MVDSVSGNSAASAARLALQLANGREPVAGKLPSAEQSRGLDVRKADGNSAPVSSEGRSAVRDMSTAPPIDTSRVSELRAAISSGAYFIDPERIAEAMLRSEKGASNL
jgi:flagellar biosynthesis anti-sigma factor FlgM